MDILSFSSIAEHIKKEINHKCDLNLSQTRILLFFDSTKNKELSMGDLAKGLNISLSTLSRQLQQTKTKDLVDIIPSAKSSSKHIKLNQNGLMKLQELKAILTVIEDKISSYLGNDQLTVFAQGLESIVKHLNMLESV